MGTPRNATDRVAKLVAALLDGEHTLDELVEASGMARSTLYAYMAVFKKHRVVHIKAWDRDSMDREVIAVWSLGNAKNAKKTPRKERRSQRYYERKQLGHDARILAALAQPYKEAA